MTVRGLNPERDAALRVLYSARWTDRSIAKAFGHAPLTISNWRRSQNLPPVAPICAPKIDEEEARRMYHNGANDAEIGRRFDALPSGVCHWRQRRGLPSNDPGRSLDDAVVRRAKKMLRLGATKDQVAAELSINRRTVQHLRVKMKDSGLRRSGLNNLAIRKQVRDDAGIMDRIEKAIGEGLPADVRHDAVLDLYTEVLQGRISACFIERQAPHFRNKAFDLCGSRFGPRSLDEEVADGWTIGDMLEDSSALVDMEAAAEAIFANDD